MPKRFVIENPLTYKPKPLPAERLRTWRAANPDKVRAARDRANVVRAALNAAPPGSVCGVCGTTSNVRLDHKRAGTLCPDCGSAVRYAETTERAITYAAEIATYRAGTAARQLA